MARKPKDGISGETETSATTLLFPKKSAWDEAAKAKREAKKRSASANGTFSKVVARLVEEEHMDRRAARLVLALDAIEDDEDLHVTVHHLIDGMKKLGILKRADAQEEMFEEHRINHSKDAKTTTEPADKGGDGKVTPIGSAARKVAEQAGANVS